MTTQLDHLRQSLEGRYRIVRELGQGGMATVYLAEDCKHARSVALKVLHAELAQSLGAERFSREIQIAAQLQHRHIVALYDSGTFDDGSQGADGSSGLYYVMPYVEGESLRQRLRRESQI